MTDKKASQTFKLDTPVPQMPVAAVMDPESTPNPGYKGMKKWGLMDKISLDWEPGEGVYDDIASHYWRT